MPTGWAGVTGLEEACKHNFLVLDGTRKRHVTLLHTLDFSGIPESFGFIKLVRKIAKSVS
jgi:hypothetical protein